MSYLSREFNLKELGSLIIVSLCLLVSCDKIKSPLLQEIPDCGSFLSADSVYAGRTKVVCQDSILAGRVNNCPFTYFLSSSSFYPSWHPDNKYLFFFHRPLLNIIFPDGPECAGLGRYDYNSAGYWLSDIDGNNMRRISTMDINNPSWSSDGKWLAFDSDAQIWKIQFNGYCFDESTLMQLTTEGLNFQPAWNSTGDWIAYRRSYTSPEPFEVQGIWMMDSEGNQKTQIFQGNVGSPIWHPKENNILFNRGSINSSGHSLGDSLWIYLHKENRKYPFAFFKDFNIHFQKYSRDEDRLALILQPRNGIPNIWIMDVDGSNRRQLTTEGSSRSFDWSPDGKKIIYTKYRFTNWTYCNGTLWTVDVDSGNQKQITFNYLP